MTYDDTGDSDADQGLLAAAAHACRETDVSRSPLHIRLSHSPAIVQPACVIAGWHRRRSDALVLSLDAKDERMRRLVLPAQSRAVVHGQER